MPRVALARRLTNDLASASQVSSVYTHDNRNSLTQLKRSIDAVDYLLGFGYDSVGNVTSISYPDGGAPLTQVYDELNRLKAINGFADYKGRGFWYDAAGNLTKMQYNNGVDDNGIITQYQYKNRGLLSRIVSPVLDLNYTYDLVGNITGINDGTYTDAYSYDGLDRLLAATSQDIATSTTPWATVPSRWRTV